MKTGRRLALILAALALASCGGDSGTNPTPVQATPLPTPEPERSIISLGISPSPVIAEETGNSRFPYRVEFNLVIYENAGLACNVNRIICAFLPSLDDNDFFQLDVSHIKRLVGTNHIKGGASLSIPIEFRYRAAFNRRQIRQQISVEVIDAKKNKVTASTTYNVI